MTSSDLENLGRIRVTAQRVLRTRRALPHHNYGIHHKPVTEVSEKLLKGKAITNTVQ